ncbi:C1 family peptidase, partial [bacterium]|nr:C1 family peptidase [bacterium]
MRSLWTWLVTGVVLLSVQAMGGQPPDNDPHAAGARRPTEEQRQWADEHMVSVGHVRLNRLGLDRTNEDRRKKGQEELTDVAPAAIGSEVSAEPTAGATPAEAGVPAQAGVPAEAGGPAYVDNSALAYFPPIRSQGTLDSCAQFSAVYYTLTHMTAMARGWDAKTGGDGVRFSPKWTYNMVNGGNDSGSWHYDAYGIAQKHGVATWADFPYDSDYRAWCLDPAIWRQAINVRADRSGRVLDLDTDAGLAQLKQLLVDGYVLNFATYIGSWQFQPISDDLSTTADDAFVGKNSCFWVNGSNTSHTMVVVGYSDDIWVDINSNGIVDAGEKGAFRIANSWGTGWQEGGFSWFAYDALKQVSSVPGGPSAGRQEGWWYREACWVTARPSYTPKMVGEFTLNHLERNHLGMTLGIADRNAKTPSTAWSPERCLWYAGGPFAFDGSTT